jgi:hypothetical protein
MVRLVVALSLGASSAQHYEPESKGVSRFVRQFFPGGAHAVTFKEAFNSTYNPYAFRGPLIQHGDGLLEQTFVSPPLTLKPGDVLNNWVPINWPEGKVHIKSYSGDIVKLRAGKGAYDVGSDGLPDTVQASREEVYLHHWTLNKWQMGKKDYDAFAEKGRDFGSLGPDVGQTHGANGPCGFGFLHFLFAAGNEVRGPPPSGENATYVFPDPYGIESDSDEMHANGILPLFNAHLIDIRGIDNLRGCTECECNVTGAHPTQDANYTGGLNCCHSTEHDGGKCPSHAAPDAQDYFVKYTLTWRRADDPVYNGAPFKPLNLMMLDQSDDGPQWYDPIRLPGSSIQAHKALHEDPVSQASIDGRKSGEQFDGHFKVSVDIGLNPPHIKPKIEAIRDGCHAEYYVPRCHEGESCVHRFRNSWTMPWDMEVVAVHTHYHNAAINATTSVWGGQEICTALPTYRGHFLVETSKCAVGHKGWQPVHVKRGEDILTETFYNQDEKPHYGVMGYAMLYLHRLDIEGSDAVLV